MRLDDCPVDLTGEQLPTRASFEWGVVLSRTKAALAGDGFDDALTFPAPEYTLAIVFRLTRSCSATGRIEGNEIARLERTGCNGRLHLVNKLQVDGLPQVLIQLRKAETHRLSYDSMTHDGGLSRAAVPRYP